jgi:hypothetical protein
MISDGVIRSAREPLAPDNKLNFEFLWLHKDETWQAYQAAWAAYSKAIRGDASGISLIDNNQRPSVFRILSTAGILRGPVMRISHGGHIERTIELALDWRPSAVISVERLETRADARFTQMYESGALK